MQTLDLNIHRLFFADFLEIEIMNSDLYIIEKGYLSPFIPTKEHNLSFTLGTMQQRELIAYIVIL